METQQKKKLDPYSIRALDYIDSILEEPEKLKLQTIVEEYSKIIIDFYLWIDKKTKEHFCSGLSELSSLWAEVHSLQEQQKWVNILNNNS